MNGIVIANLVGAAEGFFAAFVVFGQVRRRRSNLWLGLFVAACALLCAGGALTHSELPLSHPDTLLWVDGLMLAVGPLLYFYLRAFTGRPVARPWLHFLPLMLASLYLWSWHLLPRDIKLQTVLASRGRPALDPLLLLMALHALAYLIAGLRCLARESENLKQVSSNLDRISFRWLKRLLMVVLGLYLLWLPTVVRGLYWAQLAIALAFPLAVYLLASLALAAPEVFATQAPEENPDEKYRKSRLPENLLARYEQRLREGVAAKQPHLDPELSLASLAEQLGLSAHHLSQVLNERLKLPFCDYVNGLRVEEAKRLLADPANAGCTILELALRAGFSSKSTFNAVFKRSTGATPTAWRKGTGPSPSDWTTDTPR